MHLLIAPDKFKDALDAQAVAEALADGARQARFDIEIDLAPMADGGEGSGRMLAAALRAERRVATVLGPLGVPREAAWWWSASDATAIVEMAEASGLGLIPPAARNPMHTTSYGTGELLDAAGRGGARRILLCAGGSATVDGGAGALQALGFRLTRADGGALALPICGASVGEVRRIESPARDSAGATRDSAELMILVDVMNPLLGPRGAARVFGPQKGANEIEVELLEQCMSRWAEALASSFGRVVSAIPGGGAAGGLPAGLVAASDARIVGGASAIGDALDLERRVRSADVVWTGEGRVDSQTSEGKVVAEVAKIAARCGKPCVAFCGSAQPADSTEREALARTLGLSAIAVITPAGMGHEAALRQTAENLQRCARGEVSR